MVSGLVLRGGSGRTGPCDGQPPQRKQWFNVTVKVCTTARDNVHRGGEYLRLGCVFKMIKLIGFSLFCSHSPVCFSRACCHKMLGICLLK